jgi:hypothetical protein
MHVADFTLSFLEKHPCVAEIEDVLDIFPLWCQFLVDYLKVTWPKLWPDYDNELKLHKLFPGKETKQHEALGEFVSRMTFPECIMALQRNLYFKDEPLCVYDKRNDELGYIIVGNNLWPTDELYLKWNIRKENIRKENIRKDNIRKDNINPNPNPQENISQTINLESGICLQQS